MLGIQLRHSPSLGRDKQQMPKKNILLDLCQIPRSSYFEYRHCFLDVLLYLMSVLGTFLL
jgi:hypothetical protein